MLDNILFLGATSYTTPSPLVISASSEFDATYLAWNAFAQAVGTGATLGWLSSNTVNPEWLQIDLGSAYLITQYLVKTSGAFLPTDWTLLGSNTGAFAGEEVTLDTQSSLSLSNSTWYSHSFSNSTAYRYYRLSFPSATYVSIGQLSFVAPAGGGGGSTVIVVDED